MGYRASSASSTERCVTGPFTSSCTSPLTCAKVRRCAGSTTLITLILLQGLNLDGEHCRKIPGDRIPTVPGIGRSVHLAAGGAEVHAAGVERVDSHCVAQHVHVAIILRKSLGERLPVIPAGLAAIYAQLP